MGEGVCEAILSPDNVESPTTRAREVEGSTEVSRGLRLFCALQEPSRERDVRGIEGGGEEVLPRSLDRLADGFRRSPRRAGSVERLPASVTVGPAVRDVRFAEGAAGHRLQPRGSPPTQGRETTPSKCWDGVYKPSDFGILADNYMARPTSGPLSEKLQ
jgi:hypothetical protein